MDTNEPSQTMLTDKQNYAFTELQIREGIDDNSKIFFLNEYICCDPSLESSRLDSCNGGSQHTF